MKAATPAESEGQPEGIFCCLDTGSAREDADGVQCRRGSHRFPALGEATGVLCLMVGVGNFIVAELCHCTGSRRYVSRSSSPRSPRQASLFSKRSGSTQAPLRTGG